MYGASIIFGLLGDGDFSVIYSLRSEGFFMLEINASNLYGGFVQN